MKSRRILTVGWLCTVIMLLARVLDSKSPAAFELLPEERGGHDKCSSLVVRTQLGLQSRDLNNCKTPRSNVDKVCLPMCGSQSFVVDVADNAADDRVASVKVRKCLFPTASRSEVLVVFRMTRVFNGYHMYHVLNNFVVNLDPSFLHNYVFHCWGEFGCPVVFSDFFDKPLKLNSRMVNSGCYSKYIVVGEHYTTYNVDRDDVEKIERWRSWANIFKKHWCPAELLPFDHRYFPIWIGERTEREKYEWRQLSTQITRYVLPS